jgi:hypothetical protein
MTDPEPTIPPATILAARRAFIRTTAQAYAATIPAGGLSTAAILATIHNPDPVAIGVTIAAAILSPPLAGLAAALQWVAKGIPDNYLPAARSATLGIPQTRAEARAARDGGMGSLRPPGGP